MKNSMPKYENPPLASPIWTDLSEDFSSLGIHVIPGVSDKVGAVITEDSQNLLTTKF